MPGFGSAPFGSSGVGLGVPVNSTDPPDGAAGCRYINPRTGDYEVDEDTRQLKQMPATRQKVLLALKTLYGSSSILPTWGIQAPKKMGDTFEADMQAAVRAALRTLTDVQKVIRIDNIIVQKGAGGRSKTTVVYTDTSSGVDDRVTI